jgi:1-acyl-sn-glycerol-3-phosphate acyltransferase
MGHLQRLLSYGVLLACRGFSKTFYRTVVSWVAPPPQDAWDDVRLIALLNHTSLMEWLFASVPPRRFLREVADKAVLPVADVTLKRPVIGWGLRLLAHRVIPITRERDATWTTVLGSIGSDSILVIMPEGRMKRRGGLDKYGQPMTVRGGIADILSVMEHGRMLLAYSGGLHHVQAPGDRLPRLFKVIQVALEVVEIADYVRLLGETPGTPAFKQAVKLDLERRRDRYCAAMA